MSPRLPRLRLQGHHPLMFGTGTQDQAVAMEIVRILMEIVRILVEVQVEMAT